MLSRLAREFAEEIDGHDWSDSPYRLDRAGHQREFDKGWEQMPRLTDAESDAIKTNVMWVTAQVLSTADPNLDVHEFAEACGIPARIRLTKDGRRSGAIPAGLRPLEL